MDKGREVKILSHDEENSKNILNDLMTPIGGSGQNLQDIAEGEPIPSEHEMLSIEEISLLWAYLPEERRDELKPHIGLLRNSLEEKPAEFGGWQKILNEAHYGSFERQLAELMMATLAQSYREWLLVYNGADEKQIKLKRIAAAKLRELATTPSEISVAKRKYDEAFK